MATIIERLLDLIEKKPGLTESELAKVLFGPGSYQQRVNGDCRLLISRNLVERKGLGGPSDPFRYHPIHR